MYSFSGFLHYVFFYCFSIVSPLLYRSMLFHHPLCFSTKRCNRKYIYNLIDIILIGRKKMIRHFFQFRPSHILCQYYLVKLGKKAFEIARLTKLHHPFAQLAANYYNTVIWSYICGSDKEYHIYIKNWFVPSKWELSLLLSYIVRQWHSTVAIE